MNITLDLLINMNDIRAEDWTSFRLYDSGERDVLNWVA